MIHVAVLEFSFIMNRKKVLTFQLIFGIEVLKLLSIIPTDTLKLVFSTISTSELDCLHVSIGKVAFTGFNSTLLASNLDLSIKKKALFK